MLIALKRMVTVVDAFPGAAPVSVTCAKFVPADKEPQSGTDRNILCSGVLVDKLAVLTDGISHVTLVVTATSKAEGPPIPTSTYLSPKLE